MRVVGAIALIALLYAQASHCQPAQKIPRVGFIATLSPVSVLRTDNPAAQGFARGMAELGYVEGKTVIIEWRSALGDLDRTGSIVRELIALKSAVIVTVTNPMTLAAKQVTSTVPIVMASSAAPVEAGIVASLARPGGNITGLTLDAGPEILGKRMQLLKQLVPKSARVAVLGLDSALEGWTRAQVEEAGRAIGVRVLFMDPPASEYAAPLSKLARERVDAILVAQSAITYGNRRVVAGIAAKEKMPVLYPARDYVVDADGLVSYGPDIGEVFRRAAGYVDRILKGAKPGDLPIEQPTKFELVVNLKAARAMGLGIPSAVMQQADRVIQ